MGPTGPQGIQGETGPTGSTGPTGHLSETFIHAYSITPQNVSTEQPIIYDTVSAMVGNCAHLPFTSEVWLWEPGYYYISLTIHHKEPCQFSLIKNDVFQVDGGVFTSPTGSTQSTSTLIIFVQPSDIISATALSPSGFACKLEVKNHTSYAPVISLDGTSGGGSAEPDNVASFTVILLKSV